MSSVAVSRAQGAVSLVSQTSTCFCNGVKKWGYTSLEAVAASSCVRDKAVGMIGHLVFPVNDPVRLGVELASLRCNLRRFCVLS